MAEHAGARNERSTTILVSNALAAQQWELHLAAEALSSGARAWETPPLTPYAAWLDAIWLEHAGERGPALSTNQSLALWRRVVAESAESGELIGHAGAAQWAAAAWGLLHRWQIDPAAQRAGPHEVDYRAFLSWCRAYRAWLDGHGFVDRAEIEAALPARVAALGRLQLADLEEPYPARTELLGELVARGTKIETLAAPAALGTRHAARLADAADELRAAFAWAARRLASRAERVAIVVSGAARRAHEIERLAAELPGAPETCWIEGRTPAVEPAIGAAAEALALAGPHASHATFGRWLRSPFFGSAADEGLARARLDSELRAELRSQLPFQVA